MKKTEKIIWIMTVCLFCLSCRHDSSVVTDSSTTVIPIDLPAVYVKSPGLSEVVKPGTKYPINYILLPETIELNIYLLNSGSLVYTIKKQTYNDGLFKWNIPDNLEVSGQYQIKLENSDNPDIIGMSNNFIIRKY
ncbi:MAG: Ser-Thr-rich GPI-anchored membrane family protein [Bacteroidota bacterium]